MIIENFFSGFGGQGVLTMGYFTATAGMLEGFHVTYLPAYGAEVRGGTANCTVIISDSEIASPVSSFPDNLICMNMPSLLRFKDRVKSGGRILINSDIVDASSDRSDIEEISVPAITLASGVGNERGANFAMAGVLLRLIDCISLETAEKAMAEIMKGRERFLEPNWEAFLAGYNWFGMMEMKKD